MKRPVVGIVGNHYLIGDEYPAHAVGRMVTTAVRAVSDALPLIVPADPELVSVDELLETCAGFVLPGGRANVHPDEYGQRETCAHGSFDRGRDKVVLPLVRCCVERGQPILAICRGFQEMNVAMGGTLHPEIREIPGRMNHRMPPEGTLDEKFELRHDVTFTPGGVFHRMMGAEVVRTNTLHGQGIVEPGKRIVIDGRADDGTPEAIHVDGAPGFALGVQWHPEYNAANDPVSCKLFEAFGEAARNWAAGHRPGSLKTA